jgi:hypothetical protein
MPTEAQYHDHMLTAPGRDGIIHTLTCALLSAIPDTLRRPQVSWGYRDEVLLIWFARGQDRIEAAIEVATGATDRWLVWCGVVGGVMCHDHAIELGAEPDFGPLWADLAALNAASDNRVRLARLLAVADDAQRHPEGCTDVTGWSREYLRAHLDASLTVPTA